MSRGLLTLLLATVAAAQTTTTIPVQPREYQPSRPVYHQAKYASMDCGFTADPEPTNSPNPIALNGVIVVDFIIGHDGQVYSPFIRESSGSPNQDRELVHLVKSWRYRPSRCNDIPSDSEAIVVFVP